MRQICRRPCKRIHCLIYLLQAALQNFFLAKVKFCDFFIFPLIDVNSWLIRCKYLIMEWKLKTNFI